MPSVDVPDAPDGPAFDREVPKRILDKFGPEPLQRLLDLFGGEAPRLVEAISVAVDAGDAAGAVRAAHTLKSSAWTMGATRLATLCADIEARARSGSLDATGPLIEALGPALAEVLDHLAAYGSDLPPGQ